VGATQINYIQWLRQAAIADIRANDYPGAAVPDTLLYRILRQSMLLDYVTLGQFAQVSAGLVSNKQVAEEELVGLAPAPAPGAGPAGGAEEQVTPWEVLARPVSAVDQRSWAEYLLALDPPPQSPFARLADLRASFDRLATLPTAELDRLLTETLDVASHRLDAWVTSLATSRLMSERAPAGGETGQAPAAGAPLRTGGYGWVENLRPGPRRVPLVPEIAAQVDDLDARRARLHPKAGAQQGLLSLDLSGDRVRNALGLLDGVRQGQPLGALLGYRLETAMHDAGLDVYIQPLRDRFPIVGDKLTPTSPGAESVAASNVLDGLALERAGTDGTLGASADWGAGLPPVGADRTALLALFAALDDMVDAIGDVGVAEAV